uniref:TRAP transporter large permease subunit n=1 Tax=Azohydromonas aeria TaxID=2590212 RepID=UPI0012F8C29A
MKLRKELWFGFSLMAIIIAGAVAMLLGAERVTNGHIGLLMLSLVVVAIMLGFPTAFTLMGMGMLFTWLAYDRDTGRTLDLMVQSAYKVMANDVLISIPLFVFMGYLVERANLIEKLFKSLHLALARLPGSLAVATLVTCTLFATATGIVGAVVTLMGLLALPAMLRAGYSVSLSAGAITAGGCLGILIPPSVLLIVYGATAGVSVVQLYAGAFFPGLMLAGLYILYTILVAKLKPTMAPPLSAEERAVALPAPLLQVGAAPQRLAVPGLLTAIKGQRNHGVPLGYLFKQSLVVFLPALVFAAAALLSHDLVTRPAAVEDSSGLVEIGADAPAGSPGGLAEPPADGGLAEPPADNGGLREPPSDGGLQEPSGSSGLAEPPGSGGVQEPPGAAAAA